MKKNEKLVLFALLVMALGVGFLYGYRVGVNEVSGLYNSCVAAFNSCNSATLRILG